MSAARRASLGLAALLVLAATACRRNLAAPGDLRGTLAHGGRERTYLYRLPPPGVDQRPRPLVLALHGARGDGASQERLSGLSALADREGIIAVYPDGIDRSWNDGRGTTESAKQGVDDIGFLSTLIDHFIAGHGADPRRVYVMGMSNGAMMSHRAGCELSTKVAAIGAVTGLFPEALSAACAPARPVPVMMIYGLEDPLMPYAGGELPLGAGGRVLSAADSRARWAAIDRCPAPHTRPVPDAAPDDGTTARSEEHLACAGGAEVVMISVEGGGHTWPGGWQYLGERVIGRTSRDVDATAALWRFFQRHALP